MWCYLRQVDVPIFKFGDVVRVIEDMSLVFSLQEGHGQWNDDMVLVRNDIIRDSVQNNGRPVLSFVGSLSSSANQQVCFVER